MEGHHGAEVARGDGGLTGPNRKIARQLRPEGGFKRQVLARGDQAGVGQQRAGAGKVVCEVARVVAIDQHRGLVVAHGEAVGHQVVQRVPKPRDLRSRAVPGREHLVLFALHHRAGGGLGQEGKGLAGDEGEASRQEPIPETGPGDRRILLHTEDAGEPRVSGVANLQGLAAEDHPRRIDGRPEMAANQGHALAASRQDEPQHFEGFGEPGAVPLVEAQRADAVTAEVLRQVAPGVLQPPDRLLLVGVGAAALGDPGPRALGRIATRVEHQRHRELVDEHLRRAKPRAVLGVEIAGEIGAERAVRKTLMAPPDEVMPDGQMIVGEVAPGAVELGVAIIQVAHIGRLEARAVELEGHHQGLGIEADDLAGHMARIRQGAARIEVPRERGLSHARLEQEASHGAPRRRRSGASEEAACTSCRPRSRCCGRVP